MSSIFPRKVSYFPRDQTRFTIKTVPWWAQRSIADTEGGSSLATARVWEETPQNRNLQNALGTALAGLRNLKRLCHTVLQTPPKIQPMESFLPLLHIFTLNTHHLQGNTRPNTSTCQDPPLFEHSFGNLPSKWLGAGWVGSIERELFRAPGQAVWVHRLS